MRNSSKAYPAAQCDVVQCIKIKGFFGTLRAGVKIYDCIGSWSLMKGRYTVLGWAVGSVCGEGLGVELFSSCWLLTNYVPCVTYCCLSPVGFFMFLLRALVLSGFSGDNMAGGRKK